MTKIETLARKIKDCHGSGDYYKAGMLINKGRHWNMKINDISQHVGLSIPTISNLSAISKRSTPLMIRYAKTQKVSYKALRDIIRVPELYRDIILEKVVSKEITTKMITGIKKEVEIHMERKAPIDINKIIDNVHNHHYNNLPENVPYEPKQDRYIEYSYVDINNTMELLCKQLSGFDMGNIAEWQRLGLITKKRNLDRSLKDLAGYLNDDAQTLSKM